MRRASRLLAQAAELYDAPDSPLPRWAEEARSGGFSGGARWMAQALTFLRGTGTPPGPVQGARLGWVKYGLSWVAGAAAAVGALELELPWILGLLAFALVFYAVEAQMVFLFPLALDGAEAPFRQARRWTRRAGGTLSVMATVWGLAAVMLLGGLLGRGFLRSWCLGCLSVVLWYEELRGT